MSYTIAQLPSDQRPRERLAQLGPHALSSAELLAIVLGSGTRGKSVLTLAQELLGKFGSLERIAEATHEELLTVHGLGPAKALQLQAALHLGGRFSRQAPPARYPVQRPAQAVPLARDALEPFTQERFIVLLLDAKSCLIRIETVAVGTLTEALVHPREVFYPAVRHKAYSIIVAHSHPSGDPTPSREDEALTEALLEAARVMEIALHDHLLIGRWSHLSLREHWIRQAKSWAGLVGRGVVEAAGVDDEDLIHDFPVEADDFDLHVVAENK